MKSSVGIAKKFIEDQLARGAVSFSLTALVGQTGLSVVAAKNQLAHLKSLAIRISPRQQFFLIVQPEHRVIGAPPVEWWLDDYFRWLSRPYYVSLQSAAALYGSSQQAVQETQIMTDVPRRNIIIGRIRLRFYTKSRIERTATQQLPVARAPLMLSTPESTAIDLIRYAYEIGGVERAAETIAPMVPLFTAKGLKAALDTDLEISTVQRLGFVLEKLNANGLANNVRKCLPRHPHMIPLATHAATSRAVSTSHEWGIINNCEGFI